jgi:hypothetical protein
MVYSFQVGLDFLLIKRGSTNETTSRDHVDAVDAVAWQVYALLP